MPHLELKNVGLTYEGKMGNVVALSDVNLTVDPGEFVALLGPSGCGKTTLLMLIAGLLKRSQGEVMIAGKTVRGPGPDRSVVFQEAGLLPWRSVVRNVEFGLEMRPRGQRQDLRARALHYVEMVGLRAFANHHPGQLSGGMKQRVNLARALVANPELLLMDEPFAALDAQTRDMMAVELLSIWERDKKTVIFVTHSLEEAVFLSDRVVVMSRRPGRIKEVVPIDLPRPRDYDTRATAQFAEYRGYLWSLIKAEAEAAEEESLTVAGSNSA
ncbi:MAG: ATP-binding cassette domain-containing protein [Dehalococcoidia bacterium]|nr:ATP-binding cassette domain-containing protein [Dehalococcoidia bacterium]